MVQVYGTGTGKKYQVAGSILRRFPSRIPSFLLDYFQLGSHAAICERISDASGDHVSS